MYASRGAPLVLAVLQPRAAVRCRRACCQCAADSLGRFWHRLGKAAGASNRHRATILRILDNGSPRARAMQRAHGTTPLSGAVNAQRYPPRYVLVRRRGGRWLSIAGLRACAAASQVRAYTFAERRFSPALHGLGVTGHEPDGPRILSDSTGRTASSSERLREVNHTFAALPPTSPTVSPTGRAHSICWGDHLLCCGHLVAIVLQSL